MVKSHGKRKKKRIVEGLGLVHIHSSFNNTIITVTDSKGETLMWNSSGSVGFKGSRRSTSYAAQMAAEDLGSRVQILGVSEVIIILKGIGEGRNTAPKGLQKSGLKILSIKDVTPMPHNGCRPSKDDVFKCKVRMGDRVVEGTSLENWRV